MHLTGASASSWRLAAALVCGLFMVACGGGGGSSGGNETIASARVLQSSIAVDLDVETEWNEYPLVTVEMAAEQFGSQTYYYWTSNTKAAFGEAFVTHRTLDAGLTVNLPLKTFEPLVRGEYQDTLTINLCTKENCVAPDRSFTVPLKVSVGYFARPETGVEVLSMTSGQLLNHDLIAAAYSLPLDALVAASVQPSPALQVRDLSSGVTRALPLTYAPTALSLDAQGRRAVVGHDGAVSVVSLDPPGAAEATRLYFVPFKVGTAVLDGGHRVYVFAASGASAEPYIVIDLATGEQTAVSNEFNYGYPSGQRALLHPNGQRLYAADEFYLRVADLGGTLPGPLLDAQLGFGTPVCGRLWLSAGASRLFTGCGVMAHVSSDPAMDGSYAGKLTVASDGDYGYLRRIVSLSEHEASRRLLTLELAPNACDRLPHTASKCQGRLGTHDSMSFVTLKTQALPVVDTQTGRFRQKPALVFHRANGEAYVLSELHLAPEATASVWLARIP